MFSPCVLLQSKEVKLFGNSKLTEGVNARVKSDLISLYTISHFMTSGIGSGAL